MSVFTVSCRIFAPYAAVGNLAGSFSAEFKLVFANAEPFCYASARNDVIAVTDFPIDSLPSALLDDHINGLAICHHDLFRTPALGEQPVRCLLYQSIKTVSDNSLPSPAGKILV